MVVIHDIFRYSAINGLSNWLKGITLTIFTLIVGILLVMLYVILIHGDNLNPSFGY